MAQPYVGEIRMFGGNFAPAGWAFCDGGPMPIAENETLFQLIGTTYGGDGESTFARPDLRGRVPIHMLDPNQIGETGGVEEVTLTVQQVPAHTHPLLATTATGTNPNATNGLLSAVPNIDLYRETAANTPMAANAISPVGGSQPHTNFQPYLCVNFIISLFGIFPSQT